MNSVMLKINQITPYKITYSKVEKKKKYEFLLMKYNEKIKRNINNFTIN